MTVNDIIKLDFLLPSCPPDWDRAKDAKIHKMISSFVRKPIEPAGHAFMGYIRRAKHNRSLAEDYELTQALLEADGDDGDDFEDEEESPALLRLKPTSWREQDHYLVLGLSKKRFAATDEDIKRAYRKKVLAHHPDKTAHLGGNDNFFKCIQKAWEVLTNPNLRRMFDSCDPTFDESIPGPKETENFYELYGPVFERNARFSKTPGAPLLGGPDSSRAEVEAFYAFWFAFESWRTFEMKDEEDTEKAGSRDEKRWLDKKNLNKRKKLKKEDTQRLNRLIEQAIALDPRVAKFKADDKYARESKKREREANEKAAADEALRIAEEERLAKEKAEQELKEQQSKAKMDKDLIKNAIKKERKVIRRLLRDFNNFLPEGAPDEHILYHAEKVELIVANNEVSYLEEVRMRFESSLNFGYESVAAVIEEEHHYVSIAKEDEPITQIRQKLKGEAKGADWTEAENQALSEAAKAIPAGTANRWVQIAEKVNAVGGKARSALACIHHAQHVHQKVFKHQKPLQAPTPAASTSTAQKAAPAKSATAKTESSARVPTMKVPEKSDWTTEQQLQLEDGLKKYPAKSFRNIADRWDKVARGIVGKDKKQVKLRMQVLDDLNK